MNFSRGRAQDVRHTCRNVNCLVLERRWRLTWVAYGTVPQALRYGEAERRRGHESFLYRITPTAALYLP